LPLADPNRGNVGSSSVHLGIALKFQRNFRGGGGKGVVDGNAVRRKTDEIQTMEAHGAGDKADDHQVSRQ